MGVLKASYGAVPICQSCWDEKNPERKAVSVVDEIRETVPCYYCKASCRDGIFVRDKIIPEGMKEEGGMLFAKPRTMIDGAMVVKEGIMAIQVCVPSDWTDEHIVVWANGHYSCGANSWKVRKEGDDLVTANSPERAGCAEFPPGERVHVILDF